MAYAPSSAPKPVSYKAQSTAVIPGVPPGTFAPGTKVQVGNHRVVIERYLSEGGFAHVYVVRVPRSDGQTESAVLKRVAVPDKETLANMKTEVDTMKKLKGHRHIVTYIDSHASSLKDGGYEVFLLMEFCSGGGLIDFMNTRLKNRLTEPEILHIFGDVAEGVACMHYLKPPLLHRDLKVENVLISNGASGTIYKLCDFGSAASPRPAATTTAEGRLIEDDVQRHTTLQYRSPEMIDVYRNRPIDEKSDIWALGVLLYKLCYYTTPFEAEGQMAILTASFKYPGHPIFSGRLKKLIATMLMEDPRRRPNIFQVISETCAMRGKEVPLKDIYANRTHSEARSHQKMPSPETLSKSPPVVGASHVLPERTIEKVPEITPMRRGRPGAPAIKPNEAGTNVDPFAALDSKNYTTRSKAVEELSAKYPSVDEFTLLQNSGSKFQFSDPPKSKPGSDLNQRVTNALADEAFASLSPSRGQQTQVSKISSASAVAASQRKVNVEDQAHTKKEQPPPVTEPIPVSAARPKMVSTGTMTSKPASPETPPPRHIVSEKPIWRVPSEPERQPRSALGILSRSISKSPRPSKRDLSSHRSSLAIMDEPLGPSSNRSSFEGERPTHLDVAQYTHRSRSANDSARGAEADSQAENQRYRSRPFHHLRTKSQTLLLSSRTARSQVEPAVDDSNIVSDMDYLRAKELEESQKAHHRRTSSSLNKIKNASLSSKSSTGTRQILTSRFGDAFRRFEGHGSNNRSSSPDSYKTTDASDQKVAKQASLGPEEMQNRVESPLDETEELSPEMRRELERRALAQEEKRVEEAAAAYRRQVSARDGAYDETGGGQAPRVNKASAIQDRVKTLLDESGRTSPFKRTAEGYGRYTDFETDSEKQERPVDNLRPTSAKPSSPNPSVPSQSGLQSRPMGASRPNAPPKPISLRNGTLNTLSSPTMDVPSNGYKSDLATPASVDDRDWEANFAQRYPRLSLDLVETEIASGRPGGQQSRPTVGTRVKDV